MKTALVAAMPDGSWIAPSCGQRSYLVERRHARAGTVPCRLCHAPVGGECMDSHARADYHSLGRYPVRPHRCRVEDARGVS